MDDQNTRLKLLERLSTTYELTLTQDQKDAFRLIETWGMDIRSLPDFLKMDPTARGAFNQPGLNIDTTGGQHQVEDLILFSRQENNNLRIAIKEIRQLNTVTLTS